MTKTEWLTSIFGIVWGLWVANPYVTTFTSAPIFYYLAELVPELYFGLAVFLVGLTQMSAILSGNRMFRGVAALFSFFTFLTISFFCALGDYQNTAMVVYGTLAVMAVIGYTEVRNPQPDIDLIKALKVKVDD